MLCYCFYTSFRGLKTGVISGLLELDRPCHRTTRTDVYSMHSNIRLFASKMIILFGKWNRISVDPVPLKREMSPDKNKYLINHRR